MSLHSHPPNTAQFWLGDTHSKSLETLKKQLLYILPLKLHGFMSFWRVKNKPPVFRTCLEGYEITSRLAVRSLWMNCQSGTPVLRIPVLPIALCHLSFVVIKTWTGAQTNTNANIYQPLVQQNLEELSWGTLMNKNHEETRKELPYEPRTCLGHLRNNLCLPFQVCYMRLFQEWPKTMNLPYDQTPFHYIHVSTWHTLTFMDTPGPWWTNRSTFHP